MLGLSFLKNDPFTILEIVNWQTSQLALTILYIIIGRPVLCVVLIIDITRVLVYNYIC